MTDHSQALGVLLTAGMGTRLRPLTPAVPKALVPLLNRPLVTYGLELLAGMGLREIVVVVGGEDERTTLVTQEFAPAGTNVTIAVQRTPKGPGDAVASVGSKLDGRNVVVLAVDTVLRDGDLGSQMDAFTDGGFVAWLPLARTDRPQQMGIAELDGDYLVTLEEKPQQPRSDLACVGLWLLSPEAVERVRHNPVINAKDESDLTATIGQLLAEGRPVGGRRFDGRWLDGGSLPGLIEAQSYMLQQLPSHSFGEGSARGDARIVGSRLNGAVLLGSDVDLEDCELGPEVVIGDGARLRGVRLSRALVAPGAGVEGGDYADVVVTHVGAIASAV